MSTLPVYTSIKSKTKKNIASVLNKTEDLLSTL